MFVAVIFGGKSCEHNISVITAVQAMKEIEKKHTVIPVYIENDGVFKTGKEFKDISYYRNNTKGGKKIHFRPSSKYLYFSGGRKKIKIDVAVLCLHGLNGEDGTIQGLLTLSGIPFTGSGVRASGIAMDKITMKQIFEHNGLPVLPYLAVKESEYKDNLFTVVDLIKEKLTFPMIVKPSNLGSSIGISIAKDYNELFEAIKVAFMWDNRVLIENALENFDELNCGVIGIENDLTASEIEQPVGWKEFLTYDDKYMKKSKGGGRDFPAKIPDSEKEIIQGLAKRAFSAVGASGVARVDFLKKDGNIFVNEINTIPGSLANYLFPYSYSDLADRLIDIAFKEKEKSDKLKYSYSSGYGLNGSK